MRSRKARVRAKFHAVPRVQFTPSYELTSFAGLVVFQRLFAKLELRARLRACFPATGRWTVFGPGLVMLLLIVHLLLGFRRLSELRFYRNDTLVQRVLGLKTLPDKATLSRTLAAFEPADLEAVHGLNRRLVTDRLAASAPTRVTLDFDGTVQSTTGHAEGTAVGFNKKKKGARSYYPLLCTVAQTSQFLDCLHRPGNVHDSRMARPFMLDCIAVVRSAVPGAAVEVRADSAFFSDEVVDRLDDALVEFTISVPFERLAQLKTIVEAAQPSDWTAIDDTWSYFDRRWKPKSWSDEYRFVFVRQRVRRQAKGALQLDLFEPREFNHEYKVIVTNRMRAPARDLLFGHNGRGSQERVIGEGKQFVGLDLVATRTRAGNEAFTLAGLMAHNLARELQMTCRPTVRPDGEKRTTPWAFETLGTLRNTFLRRAGMLVRPGGVLTLRLGHDPDVETAFDTYHLPTR